MSTQTILIIIFASICLILLFVLRKRSKTLDLKDYENYLLQEKLIKTRTELDQKQSNIDELYRELVRTNSKLKELQKAIEFYENIEEASKTLNADENQELSDDKTAEGPVAEKIETISGDVSATDKIEQETDKEIVEKSILDS